MRACMSTTTDSPSRYGWGLVDANAAVRAAQCWENAGSRRKIELSTNPDLVVPDGGAVVSTAIEVTDDVYTGAAPYVRMGKAGSGI